MNTRDYLWSAWNWKMLLILLCLAIAVSYARTVGRHSLPRACCFVSGILVFFLTLASPLNALANGVLFSAHMLQHMLLLLIVPLLCLIGWPARNPGDVTALDRLRLPPVLAWTGGVGAMWFWHERTLCDLAASTEAFRLLQVASLLALGTLFWRPLFGPQIRQRISPLAGVVYLFSACIACSILGILITFAPAGGVCPIFMHPAAQPAVLQMIRQDWGLTAAKDQQIGGLLMWVPGCGIYLACIMAMLARWYGGAGENEPPTLHSTKAPPQLWTHCSK